MEDAPTPSVILDAGPDTGYLMVNGKPVDLTTPVSLTVKDWKSLKKLTSCDITQVNLPQWGLDNIAAFLTYVFTKRNPAVTTDDVDTLDMDQLMDAAVRIMKARQKEAVDRPT